MNINETKTELEDESDIVMIDQRLMLRNRKTKEMTKFEPIVLLAVLRKEETIANEDLNRLKQILQIQQIHLKKPFYSSNIYSGQLSACLYFVSHLNNTNDDSLAILLVLIKSALKSVDSFISNCPTVTREDLIAHTNLKLICNLFEEFIKYKQNK